MKNHWVAASSPQDLGMANNANHSPVASPVVMPVKTGIQENVV